MTDVTYREVDQEDAGQRLDNYLCKILKGVPKSHIYRIIRSGEIRINKKRAKAGQRLETGDMLRIPPIRVSEPTETKVPDRLAKQISESIIYEDKNLIVINKPSGIAVHGGSGLNFGLIEALRMIRDDLHYLELIHRLDRETSGCLLIAKKRSTLKAIHELLAARKVQKTYWAILEGSWKAKKQSIMVNQALEKNILKSGERMVRISDEGKESLTRFELKTNGTHFCHVSASPKTGRTHQIRVHALALGQPIVGDDKYQPTPNIPYPLQKRLYLHAHSIEFNLDNQNYFFEAKTDTLFSEAINFLQHGARNNEQ